MPPLCSVILSPLDNLSPSATFLARTHTASQSPTCCSFVGTGNKPSPRPRPTATATDAVDDGMCIGEASRITGETKAGRLPGTGSTELDASDAKVGIHDTAVTAPKPVDI